MMKKLLTKMMFLMPDIGDEIHTIPDEDEKPEKPQEETVDYEAKYNELQTKYTELENKYQRAILENNKIYKKLTTQNNVHTETDMDMLRKKYNISEG